MTNEERDLITQFIQRVGGAPAAAPGGFGGSVPTTTGQPPLPPIDRDADALMADLFTKYPEARYRITQLAFVEEHALAAAQGRIAQLTQQLQQMSQQQSAPSSGQGSPWGSSGQQPPQSAPAQSRGFFGSLFGGGAAAQQRYQQPQYQQPQYAPPPMQQAPGYQQGMFQRGGSGFLGSALTTAAGVAGGMVAGNALMGLFEGHHGGDASAAGFGGGGGGGFGASVSDPYNLGGAPKDDPSGNFGGVGVVDNSAWSTPDQGGGWQQPASDPGWTDTGADPAPDSGGGWTDSSSDDNI